MVKRDCLEREINLFLPIILNPKTYSLDVFENNLVLRYDNKKVQELNKLLMKTALRQMINGYCEEREELSEKDRNIIKKHINRKRTSLIYDFNPHITLAKRLRNCYGLSVPKMPIIFDTFEWNEEF